MRLGTATLFAVVALMLSGCVFANECGYSTYLYNDCVEGYDAQGIYFKKCPQNNLSNRCAAPKQESLLGDCLNCN